MPKAIPKGGKRIIQVKVNFNEPEKECLDKLVEFYKSSDASSTPSSTLRKLLINWNNLEKYVVSIDEIRSKVSDICKNNKDNLSNDILEKLYSLIEIANVLAEESNDSDKFTKRKVINNISETRSTEELTESNSKIIILKLFEVEEGNIIIDHLQEGNSVICDFSEFNFGENGISDAFGFLKGGIYGIKAKTEKINNDIYIFTPNKTEIENLSKKKSNFYSIDQLGIKKKEINLSAEIPSNFSFNLNSIRKDPNENVQAYLDIIKKKLSQDFSSDKNNSNVFLQRALTKYKNKQFNNAIKDLNDLLLIDPQLADGYYWRGNAQKHLNVIKAAILIEQLKYVLMIHLSISFVVRPKEI